MIKKGANKYHQLSGMLIILQISHAIYPRLIYYLVNMIDWCLIRLRRPGVLSTRIIGIMLFRYSLMD